MNSAKNIDLEFMKRALFLAQKGLGTVSPNPMVGAVVVKDGIVMGEGWHVRSGEGHAEVNAIKDCRDKDIAGATIYVTLEPCCHTNKKTPPCTNLLIEKKIKRVVVACLDANPDVAGHGLAILKEAGLEVESGLLEEEAILLNEVFFKFIRTKKPFVHIKLAQTLDGKMATLSGDSKWISDESCRKEVHEMRLRYDAVMVGKNTLLNDNPSLDIRMGIDNKSKTPKRIVIGSLNDFDFNSKVLSDSHTSKTYLIVSLKNLEEASEKILNLIKERNINLVVADSLEDALAKLGAMGITSILVEGGGFLINQFLEEKLFDRVTIYIAPKIIGEGISYYKKNASLMSEAMTFNKVKVYALESGHAKFEMWK